MNYTTNCKCRVIVIIVLSNTNASKYFFRFTSFALLHLPIYLHYKGRTVTSIASPGLKLSKSIFCLADSAASIDSCFIRAFALEIRKVRLHLPLVRFLQFYMMIIHFNIEWYRAHIIWRPFLRSSISNSCFPWEICRQHLWTISRDIPNQWIRKSRQHLTIWVQKRKSSSLIIAKPLNMPKKVGIFHIL